MWMMPLHLHVNQKSDYDDDDDQIHAREPLYLDSAVMVGWLQSTRAQIDIYFFGLL